MKSAPNPPSKVLQFSGEVRVQERPDWSLTTSAPSLASVSEPMIRATGTATPGWMNTVSAPLPNRPSMRFTCW